MQTTDEMARSCPLPIDIAVDILEYVDLPGTLFSAVLTSRVFWFAFESRRQHVLRSVLRRYIGPCLLPLAVATLEAGRTHDWDAVEVVLRCSLGVEPAVVVATDSSPPGEVPADGPPASSSQRHRRIDPLERISPLTRETAAALTRVHRAVEKFTLDLARPALALFRSIYAEGGGGGGEAVCAGAGQRRALEPTWRELQRIQRAFYRYQLYCNTAGRAGIRDVRHGVGPEMPWTEEQRRLAQKLQLGMWPTVANEQLACVSDFLERKMQYYFEMLAQHDVEWGAHRVDWVSQHIAVPHRRFLLNSGLLPFDRLSRTNDEGEWKRIIEEIDVPSYCDPAQFRFLDTLEGKMTVLRHSHLGTSLIMSLHGPPGIVQAPRGPPWPPGWKDVDGVVEYAQKVGRRPLYMTEACRADDMLGLRGTHLREAGCVFWDGAESARVATDAKLRKSAEHGWRYSGGPGAAAEARALAGMRRSWAERAQIWARGGAGHWEEGDDSRVVYDEVPRG